VVLTNTLTFPCSIYGIHKIGGVSVPINYRIESKNFTTIFDNISPTVVVYSEQFSSTVETGVANATVEPELISVRETTTTEACEDLFETDDDENPPERTLLPSDLSHIIHTSGTTGDPKAAAFSVQTALRRIEDNLLVYGMNQHSVCLQLSPWFHGGGIDNTIQPAIYEGAQVVVTNNFSPDFVLETIEEYEVTHVVTVPTVTKRIASHENLDSFDLSSIDVWVVQGSPLSEQMAKTISEKLTPNIYNVYGTTENHTHTILVPEDLPEHAGTAGRPVPTKEIRVVEHRSDEDRDVNATLPPNTKGEVIVKGEANFDYYYNGGQETKEAMQEGWFFTGDIGIVDEQDYLTITGRADDQILSGGELISPIEVEDVLEEHKHVDDAIVVGQPDEEWGDIVVAYVVADESITATDLDEYCKSNKTLANYKRPREYDFVSEIERTATGKKERYKYRE
jgi:acyl-CoA synthetase (AMP-forming)/AMP-acid ligase II